MNALWISIVLFLLLVGSIFIIRNLLRKLEALEDISEIRDNWIVELKQRIDFIHNELEELDSRGSFKSDDEIGFFFTEAKRLSGMLDEMIDVDENIEIKNK